MKSRREKRYRVHLSVRYTTAVEFVREYAENLSKGGLFVTGGEELTPRQQVQVEIDLPGFRSFSLRAEVAHVMDRATAARFGRRPGAGLAICDAPDNFWTALSEYLHTLGRRTEMTVMVALESLYPLLDDAGYCVERVPAPGKLREVLNKANRPVIGIVVDKDMAEGYKRVAARSNQQDLIIGVSGLSQLDEVLIRLDDRLLRIPPG